MQSLPARFITLNKPMDIYLFFMIFLIIATATSYAWGEWSGRKKGQQDLVVDMLARKLVTTEQLEREYID